MAPGMGKHLVGEHTRRAIEEPLIARLLQVAYRRLGSVYPTLYLVIELQAGFLISAGTAALLLFYIDTSAARFFLFLGIVLGLTAINLIVAVLHGHKLLRPVRAWINGTRTPEHTVQAWQVASTISVEYWQKYWHRPIWMLGIPGAAAGVIVFEQHWAAFFPLLAGGLVAIAYAAILHNFAAELGLRPVLLDMAEHLPQNFRVQRPAVPLRVKLMAALPVVNIITAIVVSGFSADDSGLANLGIDVLLATAVAFTISLELTVMLSRTILFPIRDLLEATDQVQKGDFSVKVPVTTNDEIGQLGTAFNEMVAGLAERERIREAFGTYLDHEVAEHILREGASPEGEEVEVSILFCDVRDFTRLASQVNAHELVGTLNRLFETIVPIVAKHGGHVDKFVGDGLLAVFGAPQKHPDHADRAVAAALDIARAVTEDGPDGLRIGIGINSGQVVAGSMGGAGRLEFTVIGDAVNVASRVETATRETGDDILITEDTRRLLSGTVQVDRRPGVALKGKAGPVDLFAPRVGAPVEQAVPAEATVPAEA
jgi:adenylate cyclase